MGQEVIHTKVNRHVSGSKGKSMKKKTSSRKINANRQNAFRSTGPRTAQGKKKVRLNALKHGFFSKEAFIKKGDGRESKAEYNRLRESVVTDLQPEGALEEMIVDLIISHFWRLRRVFRYETGSLRLRLDTAELDQENRRADNLQWELKMLPCNEFKKNELRQSSNGIRFLIRLLGSAHKELKENGFVTDTIHQALVKCFGENARSIGGMCSRFVKHARKVKKLKRPAISLMIKFASNVAVESKSITGL